MDEKADAKYGPFPNESQGAERLPAAQDCKTVDADSVSREADIFTNFLRRFAAYLIDSIFTLMITISCTFYMINNGQSSLVHLIVISVAFMMIWFLYYWLNEAWLGSTIGKWALRIRVVDREGQMPGLKKSLIRNSIRIAEFSSIMLSGLVAGVLVMALPSKQRLGDMAAGTYVIAVRHTPPLSKRKLSVMRTLFIILSIAGAVGAVSGTMSFSQWIQSFWNDQSFQTTDGRYAITVPEHWQRERDIEDGLFISSFISEAYVYIEGATEEEMSEYPTLELYSDYVMYWLPDNYSADLDDIEPDLIELNGNPAYRYTMNAIDEDGYRQSFTVTVTGDGERHYFILAGMYDTGRHYDSIESFREQHVDELDKLDRWVRSFKSVRGSAQAV